MRQKLVRVVSGACCQYQDIIDIELSFRTDHDIDSKRPSSSSFAHNAARMRTGTTTFDTSFPAPRLLREAYAKEP